MTDTKNTEPAAGDNFDPSTMADDADQDLVKPVTPTKYVGKTNTNFGGGLTGKTNSYTGYSGNYGGGNTNIGGGAGLPSDRYSDSRIEAEEQRYREHTSLSVWLVKFITVAISVIIVTLLVFFGYVTAVNKSLPDMGVFGQFFGGLVQIVSTVFSLGSR